MLELLQVESVASLPGGNMMVADLPRVAEACKGLSDRQGTAHASLTLAEYDHVPQDGPYGLEGVVELEEGTVVENLNWLFS